jgi:hypothetical protein
MFKNISKYLLGLTMLAVVAFAISMFYVHPAALAAVALLGLFTALSLFAGVSISLRDGDSETGATASLGHPAPTSSMWPLITAVGAAMVLFGTITNSLVFVLGIVVLLAALVEWSVLAWSEGASSDAAFNSASRKRLLNPIEFPILAAVGLGVVIFSFSRVMLAVNKDLGAVLFIVIGVLVLLGGVLFAFRPTLKRGLVTTICVTAAVGLLAAGIGGASVGNRSELVVAAEENHYASRECGPEASSYGDKGASQTISSKSGVIATINFEGRKLTAQVQGVVGTQDTITIPRSNPSSIIFRNFDAEPVRLVAHLGKRELTADVSEDVLVCTQLTDSGGEQLLTLTIPKPSNSNGPYSFRVAGIDGQSIDLVVP